MPSKATYMNKLSKSEGLVKFWFAVPNRNVHGPGIHFHQMIFHNEKYISAF